MLRINDVEGNHTFKRRFVDVVKEDRIALGVAEKDTQDRVQWRSEIRCGDP